MAVTRSRWPTVDLKMEVRTVAPRHSTSRGSPTLSATTFMKGSGVRAPSASLPSSLLRHRDAEMVDEMDELQLVALLPGQRAEEAVRDHGANRGLVMGDGRPQPFRLLALPGR